MPVETVPQLASDDMIGIAGEICSVACQIKHLIHDKTDDFQTATLAAYEDHNQGEDVRARIGDGVPGWDKPDLDRIDKPANLRLMLINVANFILSELKE